MNKIELIPYQDEDYDFVYELKKIAYKGYIEEFFGKWDEEEQLAFFKKFIDRVRNNILIMVEDGKKIGFYDGEFMENGNYFIGNICILPDYQNKGIGTYVLKTILDKYSDYDIELRYFKSNPAGNLYKKLGFKPNGEIDTHYYMIKEKLK